MFCMQCGAKLPDNAKFCFQCGAKVLIDTSAHEATASVEPKSVQEAGQNEQDSKVEKTPMVPKEELVQPEKKVVLKLGNRNLEFSEEIKDKIAMTSYYNDIGKANGEKLRKFYQDAQIAVMEDVMKKVYPFYDNLVEQTNRIAFQRLLSRKIYDIREADYYGKIQHTSLKGKEPLKFYSEYRRDYLQGGRTGKEKLANPVNTMMCFEEALKDHAYILKMIEARILVEHGLLKEYNFDTVKIDTRRENIKSVFDSVCNRKHTDQEIQKAYEDVLNADIDGIQVNPFKALYYAEIYSIGKILKNYEGTNAQLLPDLFKAIDFFEVRESCEDAINQIARNQLKKKLEELHQSPDKAPMLYQQMLQIANEVKEDNPLFDLADFNDELNQCAMAWLNLKLDEVHKSPDQILTLYPQLIQILNRIKVDMPLFNAVDFMEYAECCKEQILECTEFCDEYSFYTDQVMQGKMAEVLKAADLNNAAAQYVLEKYYREVILPDAIKYCDEKFLHGVMFYLTEERTNESDFRLYLEFLFRFEMFIKPEVTIIDAGARDKANSAMAAIRNLADKRKPCIAAVRRIGTYYLEGNSLNSAMPYLKLAAEQHDPVAMAICGEALYLKAKDDRVASEKGYCYLRSATFAGEVKALNLNKKYNLGYPVNIMLDSTLGKYKQITTEKCFVTNGETIQMTVFPRVVINKYRGNLRGIDLLLNECNELLQSTQLSNVRKSCKIPAQEKVYMAYSMDSFSHFKDGMTGFAIGATGFYAKSGFLTAGCIPWKKFIKLKIYQEGGLHIGEYTFFSQDQEVTLMDFMEDLQKLCKDSLIEENADNKALLNSSVVTDIKSPKSEEEFKQTYACYRIYAMQGELGYLWKAANANDPIAQFALTQYYRYDVLEKTIDKDKREVFDRVLLEVDKFGDKMDYAEYLKNYLKYELDAAHDRIPRYGVGRNIDDIIRLAEKENACISAVATAGRFLTMLVGDEPNKKGVKYLIYAAEKCAPDAMTCYGKYLLKGGQEGIEKNPDKAGNYLKLAVYAQEREALAINKQYNLGYATIDLGGAHILNKETAFVDDGKIKMISFPWSLFVHYSTKLTTWPRDVLMNGGKELAPSQELNFARESFEIPSSEKIYFVLAANLLGHFKKNMRMKDNKPNGNGALFAYSARNGLSLEYVGKFKDGKIDGKGISFTYDGLVHYLAHAGNYEKNMATGKMTTYYDNDCQAVGNFFLYKFGDYIDEMSEKWSEDELVRQIDLLLPQKRVLKLIVTVNLYESPSTTVDFNQRVLIPHIKYEGEMKKGSIEGKGKLYASNGWLAYDGEWKKDKYNGKGILYNQDGTIRKKGTFDNEAPDEELIYSNLATASLLASDKISLEELFALDDSDTSANTTQTATAENSNTAASIQSDAIPPEVSGCEKDGTWQKILVEATGSNATLTLWSYRDGQWEKDLSTTAAIGANGLTTDKTEGDHMTPEGTFPICFAFSTKEKNTMLYSKIIKEDSVWVCDPESIYYNTLQSKNDPYKDWADKGGAENMYPKFSKGSSNACICFGFNGDGLSAYSATPYAGSALFIDGVGENGNMNSGYGDIKISGKDMTKLLSYLCANDNPVITIKSAQ